MRDDGRDLPSNEDLATILLVAKARARSCGATEDESDEVAQSTAVRLLEKWNDDHIRDARSRGDARWQGYISQMARNLHFDLIRGHQRWLNRHYRASTEALVWQRPLAGSASVPACPCAVDPLLARAAIAEEILRLPAEQRIVASMAFLDEMSSAEIAEIRGVQSQTIRKHLRQARHTLEQRLGKDLD